MKRTLAIVLCVLMMLCFLPASATMAEGELPFTDVDENAFYYDAVVWAYQNGITSGTSATTFSPDKIITRREMAQMAWAAAGRPMPATSFNPFKDVQESAYYFNAAKWAWENGVFVPFGRTFNPKAQCKGYEVLRFALGAKFGEGPIGVSVSMNQGYCSRAMAVYTLYMIVDQNVPNYNDFIIP